MEETPKKMSLKETRTREEILSQIEKRKVQVEENEGMIESCKKNITELVRQIHELAENIPPQ